MIVPNYSQKARQFYPMFDQCWPTVYDVDPTLVKHWVKLSCLLGRTLCLITWCSPVSTDTARAQGSQGSVYVGWAQPPLSGSPPPLAMSALWDREVRTPISLVVIHRPHFVYVPRGCVVLWLLGDNHSFLDPRMQMFHLILKTIFLKYIFNMQHCRKSVKHQMPYLRSLNIHFMINNLIKKL